MGFDLWCPLCGAPLNGGLTAAAKTGDLPDELARKVRAAVRGAGWVDRAMLLLPGGRTLRGVEDTTGSGRFEPADPQACKNVPRNGYDAVFHFAPKGSPVADDACYAVHPACRAAAKKATGRELAFEDLLLLLPVGRTPGRGAKPERDPNLVPGVNYGAITRFHWQDFDLPALAGRPRDHYLLATPMGSTLPSQLNRERVAAVARAIFARVDRERRRKRPARRPAA